MNFHSVAASRLGRATQNSTNDPRLSRRGRSGDLLHQRPDFKAAFGNATKRGVDATDFEKLALSFPDMIKPQDGEFIVRKARQRFLWHPFDHLSGAQKHRLSTGDRHQHLRLCARHGLDGYSFGYPVFLVEECVFDRSRTSHLVNLFEMNAKYATVIQLEQALNYVSQLKRVEGRKAIAG